TTRAIRIVPGCHHVRCEFRLLHPFTERPALPDPVEQEILQTTAPRFECSRRADEPDAADLVSQRDDPEPSILCEVDGNAAHHVAFGPTLDVAEMAIYRRGVVALVGLLLVQLVGHERVPTGRVEHITWVEKVRSAILVARCDTG